MNRTDNAAATVAAYALFTVTLLTGGPGWLVLGYLAAVVVYGLRWARQHRRDRIARIQDRQRRWWGGPI